MQQETLKEGSYKGQKPLKHLFFFTDQRQSQKRWEGAMAQRIKYAPAYMETVDPFYRNVLLQERL